MGVDEGEGEDDGEDQGVDEGEAEDDGKEKGWRGGLRQERRLFNSCPWSFPGPAAEAPALEHAAAKGGKVVAELRRLRRAPSPGLDAMKRVLDHGDDLKNRQ